MAIDHRALIVDQIDRWITPMILKFDLGHNLYWIGSKQVGRIGGCPGWADAAALKASPVTVPYEAAGGHTAEDAAPVSGVNRLAWSP